MRTRAKLVGISALCLGFVLSATPAFSQPRGPGRRRFRRPPSPEELRQRLEAYFNRRLENLKRLLKPKDEAEWQILQMQIKKIFELQRAAFAFRRRRGEEDPLYRARDELRRLVQDENTSPATLKAALEKYRKLREERRKEEEKRRAEAEQKLKAAREELRGLLTLRQEAILVLERVLE